MTRKRSIEGHESEFWHVRKFDLLPLASLIVFGLLAYANFLGILEAWSLLKLGSLRPGEITGFAQFLILPIVFVEWFLVAGFFVSLAALKKGGYEKLKPINKDGLLDGLLAGLLFGLLVGLLAGLLVGLLASLLAGLLFGLLAGLLAGLLVGLPGEFD